jgi:uncharacterized membrane protein YccF (DUF307 family)
MSEQVAGPGSETSATGASSRVPPPTQGPLTAPGRSPGAGSVMLNILWLVLSGVWLAIAYVVAGIIQCVFIITIPFGVQCFKLAGFALWPFGRAVVKRPNRSRSLSAIGNFLWFFLAGIWLALVHLITGVLLCITIIGIPLGVANFKMMRFALVPFGKDIVKRGEAYGDYVAF